MQKAHKLYTKPIRSLYIEARYSILGIWKPHLGRIFLNVESNWRQIQQVPNASPCREQIRKTNLTKRLIKVIRPHNIS